MELSKSFVLTLSPQSSTRYVQWGCVSRISGVHYFKIDQGHDVSWFSELREVSVLFLNLDPGSHMDASETLNLLQNSFNSVYPALVKYHGKNFCATRSTMFTILTGTLNKVFMFDKVSAAISGRDYDHHTCHPFS